MSDLNKHQCKEQIRSGRVGKASVDFQRIRDESIPIPIGEGYKKVLLLGTTGAGKTTLLRQLIGTGKAEGFPTTSTAKTTIADTEIICSKGAYEAAVTFMSYPEVRGHVEECLGRALFAAWEKEPQDTIQEKLLEHGDQRIRFNYILGEDSEFLSGVVHDIKSIADETGKSLVEQLEQEIRTDKDKDAFEGLLADEFDPKQNEQVREIVDRIMGEIHKRFNLLEGENMRKGEKDWPECWRFASPDRVAFLGKIRPFFSNNSEKWGELLTPLVNGMRVRGEFSPKWGSIPGGLVIVDGEGLGHVSPNVSSVTISTKIARQMDNADAIILVDNATQPMLAAPAAVLMDAFLGGNADKLFVCFTRMDHVEGDNLPNFKHKKRHVRKSAENAINSIGQTIARKIDADTGNFARRVLNGRIRQFCYVGRMQETLDNREDADKTSIEELSGLVQTIFDVPDMPAERLSQVVAYNEAALCAAISESVEKFRDAWHTCLYGEHWTRVKALTRRLAEDWDDEYDTLKPLAELGKGIQDAVHKSLIGNGESDDKKDQQVAIFLRSVRGKVAELVKDCVWVANNPHTKWEEAYAQKGRGSASVRRDIILGILSADNDEPSPGPASKAFVAAVAQIVKGVAESGNGES